MNGTQTRDTCEHVSVHAHLMQSCVGVVCYWEVYSDVNNFPSKTDFGSVVYRRGLLRPSVLCNSVACDLVLVLSTQVVQHSGCAG